MRLFILRIRIVAVVGRHQLNPRLLCKTQKPLIRRLLLTYTVILQFKEEIPFPKNVLVFVGRLLCLFVESPYQILLYFPGKTGTQRNQPAAVLSEDLLVHTWLIIVPLGKSPGHNLHQIVVALFIFGQQNKVIVTIFTVSGLPVKPGSRRHINFAPQDRIDPL